MLPRVQLIPLHPPAWLQHRPRAFQHRTRIIGPYRKERKTDMYDVESSHPLLRDGSVEVPLADLHARGQPFTGRSLGERDIGCGDVRVGVLVQEGKAPNGLAQTTSQPWFKPMVLNRFRLPNQPFTHWFKRLFYR